MDYGKYLYERAKRERKARRAQKSTEMKEVRLRPKTSDHDRARLMRRARTFLQDGFRVRVRVRFRGREMAYPDIGRRVLEGMAEEVQELATVELRPKMEGRSIIMILSPIADK